MHLHSYGLRNYRRLNSVHIELAEDISIFVSLNNSGKTSATQAVQAFLSGTKDRFTLYDFSSAVWNVLDEAGDLDLDGPTPGNFALPSIDLALWFEVAAPDLYLVIPPLRRSTQRPACQMLLEPPHPVRRSSSGSPAN